MPSPGPTRLLLVGYGERGRQWQDTCRRRRDVVVVGAVDPDPAAQEAARRAGLEVRSTIEEVVRQGGAEAAIVASPPWEHPAQARECMLLGAAVLVEKPLALSLEDAVGIVRESSRLGIPALVGQNFRFLRRERAVRKALAAGVGTPLSVSVVSTRPPSAAMPHLASVEHGPLWDICLHHLDALRVRFGGAPESVAMTVTPLGAQAGVRTLYQILLEWAGGPTVVYRHTEGAPGYHHSEWIECERQAILVENQRVRVLFPRHRARPVIVPGGPKPERVVLDEFLRAVRAGEASTLGVDDNLGTIATVAAALRSEALGRAVTLPEVEEAAGVALGSPSAGR